MTGYNLNIEGEWKDVEHELPPKDKPVEVICALRTQAVVNQLTPCITWKQIGNEQAVGVLLWREIEQSIDNGIPCADNAGSDKTSAD